MRSHLNFALCGMAALLLVTGALAESHPSARPPLFSFGAIADVQYCDCESTRSRFYRASIGKLKVCVQDLNTRKLAFTIQLGDLIDRKYESFGEILPHFEKLKMPTYHVLGNHDYAGGTRKFAKVLKRMKMERRYYHFTVKGWRMIVLDGNDLSGRGTKTGSPERQQADDLLAKAKAAGRPNARGWNGALGAKQLTWLDDTLSAAEKVGQRAIIFCHFPIFPDNSHNLWNDSEVIKVLENHSNVAAYLNGHNHKGHYGEKQGIHYLTVHGMVETAKKNAYAVVDVYPNQLVIRGIGRVPNRSLSLRPMKAKRITKPRRRVNRVAPKLEPHSRKKSENRQTPQT